MALTEHELNTLKNTDFLITKARALAKIEELLLETRVALESTVSECGLSFSEGTITSGGKVSRGENYRGLPYRILDQPALLTAGDIFAFRTMFWWGHFFSATLHLQGASLERFREGLADRIELLADGDTFICIGETPWEYHYKSDNYRLLRPTHRNHLSNCNFLKLSRKMDLAEWERLPLFAAGFLKVLLSLLEEASPGAA